MTTLTGVLNDSGGNPITGSLWLELSQAGTYNPGGILVTPLQPSTFTLTNGQITGPGAGPYTVYGNDGITPSTTWYALTAFDSSGQQVLRVNVRIEGASVDLGALTIAPTQNWTPPVGPGLTLAGDVTGPLGATVVQRIRGRSVAAPPWTTGYVLTVQGDGTLGFTSAAHTHTGLLSGLTSGYLPRASGVDTVVNSPLFTDGTSLGLGTETPTDALHIRRTGSRAALFLDGQGAGGYAALKLECDANTSAFLVSAGNVDGDGGLPTGAGFSIRDTNANVDRLIIFNSGIVDVPGTLTTGGTQVSVVGHTHGGVYQPADAELTAIAGLVSAADRLPYFTGAGTAALATFTAAGRNLLDDASTSDQRTTLGLGTLATQNANAVAITGGTLAGLTSMSAATLAGTGLTSGYLPKAGTGGLLGDSPVYTDGTKVGIGATALLGKLTVRESDTGAISFTDFSTFAPAWYAANGPIGGIRLGWKYLTAAPNNVELQAIRGADSNDGAGLGIFTSTSNALDAVERVRVTSGGNVLIGTTTSTGAKLEVNGDIKATAIKLTTGASNGYVLTSDADGDATWQAFTGGMTYKGTWDASTNSPTLADGVGTAGDTYAVTVGGTQFTRTFTAGGWAIYNGSIWQPVSTSVSVTSVNGLTGAVSLGLASSAFVNQGTTATVLHGNAAGNPSWGAVSLSADVSGTLPLGNGGTGLTTLTAGRIPYGAGASPLASTDKLVWDPTIEHLKITAKKGLISTGDCALQITSEMVGADGERAAMYLQGLGAGGYAAVKLGCNTNTTEFLISAGNVGGAGTTGGAGFAIRDTNAGADRLTISNTTGIVDAAAGLTVGGTPVSLSGHAHAASAITNTPAGNIAATTVQAAINELDTEKAPTSHSHTGLLSGLTSGRMVYATGADTVATGTAVYASATDTLTTKVWDNGGQIINAAARGVLPSNSGAVNRANLQAALDSAYNGTPQGARCVYVPSGLYDFDTHLTVPFWATLMGDEHGDQMSKAGTIFRVTEGAGNASGTPFLSVQDMATVKNIAFTYPNQVTTGTPVAYPFTIYLGGSCTVDGVFLENSYQGIDSATGVGWNVFHGANNIRRVRGMPLLTGIHVDQSYDVTRVEDVHFWPFVPGLAAWVESKGTAMKIGRSDWQMTHKFFCYGYNTGVKLYYSTLNATPSMHGGASGRFYDMGFDKVNVGFDVDATHFMGVDIHGMTYACNTMAATRYGIYGRTGSGTEATTAYLRVDGLYAHGSLVGAVEWGNGGLISVSGARVMNWGPGATWNGVTPGTAYAINVTRGRAIIQQNYFADSYIGNGGGANSANGIRVTSGSDRCTVVGNMMVGKTLSLAALNGNANVGNTV